MDHFLSAADLSIIIGSVLLVTTVGVWVGRHRPDTAHDYSWLATRCRGTSSAQHSLLPVFRVNK